MIPELPAGARYWFTVVTCFGNYSVVLANADVQPELVTKWGYTELHTHIIWLDEDQPESCLPVTLTHEIAHASIAAPGEEWVSARVFGCTVEEANDREEAVVAYLTARLGDALYRSGLIQLPPLPQ